MKIEVRYYSRSGNTKLLAEHIAKALNVEAKSIKDENSKIENEIDILFIGGALYAYGLDKYLKEYLEELDSKKIKKAIVFSTSWLSKHSIDLIKKELMKKEIPVEEEYIYYKNKPSEKELEEAGKTAKRLIEK
ncbi:MAG: flavodoxin [Bacilli bacterium]|nr:flavodoxin [Bacilli bacterium]